MNTSTRPLPHRRSGFTLIELLVVISIIAILASLAFPAVNGAIDSARKAQAKNTVVQIAAAVTGYETEYGILPGGNGTTNVGPTLVDILTGNNPREIVFLEAQEWKKGKGGTNANGYCDPWDSTKAYAIDMDTDYDNDISVSTNGAATGSVPLRKKVGVWNVNTNTRYQVRSWD